MSKPARGLLALAVAVAVVFLAGCGSKSKKSVTAATVPATTTTTTSAVTTTTAAGARPSGTVNIPVPKGSDLSRFGLSATVVMTANDAPLVAYIDHDPNDDKKFDDSTVYAAVLDPKTGTFSTPVAVAKGDYDDRGRQLSAAYDPSTKTVGVTWTAAQYQIDAAFSADGGLTWKRTTVIKDPDVGASSPSLALGGGKATVAYVSEGKGVGVATAPTEDAQATWTPAVIPPLGDRSYRKFHPGIVAGADGTATVAVLADATGGGVEVDSWTVGASAPVKVFDSNTMQNDSPSVGMSGSGSRYVIVATMCRPQQDDNCLLSSVSTDGGKTWGTPVKVPDDGTDGASFQTEVAASPTAAAVVWSPNSSNGADSCGRPELSRSPDQRTWTSCLFDKGKTLGVSADNYGAAFASDGSLYLVFNNSHAGEAPALGGGVWLVKQAP